MRKGSAMPDVQLVDLPVIKRYSLAVRQESAPAAELLAALEESRAMVLAALGQSGGTARRRQPTRRTRA
jgi:hypothetical protein